ncbi:HAD family hydrolase [Halobacteria archaeon AArc-m2/3/4]|uniref:HAD family hydrolase n=1 Tax=Natronoglomus mannanivorans TaxID=2979990 RepID=A0ABT2QAD5_9EURY|nr:HAD family hydrolase [Halobacteria archaeon AArc-m2/3/4]
MSRDVKAVLFDLDETLCERPRRPAERLAAAFDRAGVEPFFTADEYHRLVNEIGGTDSDIRRRERCFERLAREYDRDETVGRQVADAYQALTDYTAVQFLPGAERVLEDLEETYRLGLVTNGGPDTQSPKIDALGIRDRFETVVLAGYDTPAKPDPTPFRTAMANLDVSPERTIYVGNSLRSDIAGASASEIRSVWIPYGDPERPNRTQNRFEPDYTLESIEEALSRPWEGD